MKIYFSYEHIPEMSDVPANARYKIWREFLRSLGFFSSLWRGIVVFFAFMIPFYMTFAIIEYYEKMLKGTSLTIIFAVGVVVSFLSCITVNTALCRAPFRKYMSERNSYYRNCHRDD